MEEIELERKFNNEKYFDILSKLDKLRSNQDVAWSKLQDYSLIANLYDIPNGEYKDDWDDLIKYMKGIEEGKIPTEKGKLIAEKDAINNFKVPNNPRSAWQRFKKQLKQKDIYSLEEIANIENDTINILNHLSIETDEPRKGMIVGYVQSGKTTSIESLITMAADYKFNLFIVLSGMIENLREQNLQRMENDIKYVKDRNNFWEFSPDFKNNEIYKYLNSDMRVVTVCLKNSRRLQELRDWIFDNSEQGLKNTKIILIDDEADQASLNTKDINSSERSKINQLIMEIINNKDVKAMNYVGYTATPYGNFLNEMSTYPKDFIYSLSKSKKYIGAEEIFGIPDTDNEALSEGLNIKQTIIEDSNDCEKDEINMIKNIEKGISNILPESLKDAICWFIITVAIFRYEKIAKPVSMLIHTNIRTETHRKMYEAIKTWIIKQKNDVDGFINRCKKVYDNVKISKKDFYSVMKEYPMNVKEIPNFGLLIDEIKNFIIEKPQFMQINDRDKIKYNKGINMVVDNCNIDAYTNEYEYARLAYPKKEDNVDFATAFIIIGGNTLSRGLTIEGLTTTYFCRQTGQMDTLMQMGRWFGYRVGYELLPRIWLDNSSLDKFRELARVEYLLRENLKRYNLVSPMDYGPVIQNSYLTNFIITSKSKMQSCIPVTMNYSGAKAQTTLFDKNEEIQKENIKICDEFLNKIDDFKYAYNQLPNLVKEDVPFEIIKNELLLKFHFCKRSNFFNNIETFCDWIDKVKDENLKKWNVIVASVKNSDYSKWNVGDYSLYKVRRSQKKYYDNENYFSIGSLRSTKDIISDVYVQGGIKNKSEKEIINIRENIKKPQIIIYMIDHNSRANLDSKYKEDLKIETDLMGMYLFVPGDDEKNYKNYEQEVTIKLNNDNIDEEEE